MSDMIEFTRLLSGAPGRHDGLRYGRTAIPPEERRPVVVFTTTLKCNLACSHCYSDSCPTAVDDVLDTPTAMKIIDDLAQFGVPVLLFSGGEPLLRKDIFDLIAAAADKNIRPVVSTNGTLITASVARDLKNAGLAYAGISLDGLETVNDRFRKSPGAFRETLRGFGACRAAGLKTGLRFTMNDENIADLDGVFDLLCELEIPRACFYHLAYSGRGKDLRSSDLSHERTRRALTTLLDRTERALTERNGPEVLTVDNHCDGPWLVMRMRERRHPAAGDALELLRRAGGNASGVSIACIGDTGEVFADQFMRSYSFGNVLQRPFGEIWTDLSDPFMKELKRKELHVTGKCRGCRWLDVCGGNLRARAYADTGERWGVDPACYLTTEEIE